MGKIKLMQFEVCGLCQNNCFFCAHDGMLSKYKGYQLSIEELEKFIDCTKQSNYFIEELNIHGIGEPLLWKHFDEGIMLLKDSGVIGKIFVTTNGLLLDRVKDETMRSIDILKVSVYPKHPKDILLTRMQSIYGDKIEIDFTNKFIAMPTKRHNKTPCFCMVQGPMFVKDKIFFYCGPPVFDAANLRGVDIFEHVDLYTKIRPNYLESFVENNIGNIEFCNYCWANWNIKRASFSHGSKPSKSEVALMNVFANFNFMPKNSSIRMISGLYAGLKKMKNNYKLKKFKENCEIRDK